MIHAIALFVLLYIVIKSMKHHHYYISSIIQALTVCFIAGTGLPSQAQTAIADTPPATSPDSISLQEVTVTHRAAGTHRLGGPVDATRINRQELFKAACCNLGESFTTNPSVDVNYSDAATGARQIKLLGLSGTYVQMLSENMPNWRGAAIPYALGYIPGPWMKSILVSKGASSVRNGYESITGQIDVEFLKPEDEQGATINLYGNSEGRIEVNADANRHLTSRLNTEVLAHYERSLRDMDGNDDGFMDMPHVRQFSAQNRWDWLGDTYIFHGGLALLDEDRQSGQTHDAAHDGHRYEIGLKTHRYEGYMKHAFFLDRERGTNIALMASATLHRLDAHYGNKRYKTNERNLYAQLMFETTFTVRHTLSAGLSINHDDPDSEFTVAPGQLYGPGARDQRETTSGAYAQYTFNADDRWIVMAGIRADHSSLHGTFVTPRLHLKFAPTDKVSCRATIGKGYRTTQPLAQYNYLMASGRSIIIDELDQEAAWNMGTSIAFSLPIAGKLLKANLEYYYTYFDNQTVVDYEMDPGIIYIHNLGGLSYSRTFQADVSYPILSGLELTAACRINNVKTTMAGLLDEKPLTNRYKGLITASYRTPLGIWQFDVTLQLNGGGRLPNPYLSIEGAQYNMPVRFHAFEQLNAQVTRWFRHFSIYIGGENLTGRRQSNPIINAANPWSEQFEPTLVWGPVTGAMAYAGIRINLGRTL